MENAVAAVNGFAKTLIIVKISLAQNQPLVGSFKCSQMRIFRILCIQFILTEKISPTQKRGKNCTRKCEFFYLDFGLCLWLCSPSRAGVWLATKQWSLRRRWRRRFFRERPTASSLSPMCSVCVCCVVKREKKWGRRNKRERLGTWWGIEVTRQCRIYKRRIKLATLPTAFHKNEKRNELDIEREEIVFEFRDEWERF